MDELRQQFEIRVLKTNVYS